MTKIKILKNANKKISKSYWISLVFSVVFVYFGYVTWVLLIDKIGTDFKVWLISGLIVLIGILIGHFNFRKTVRKVFRA